jgi:hypothetical protein
VREGGLAGMGAWGVGHMLCCCRTREFWPLWPDGQCDNVLPRRGGGGLSRSLAHLLFSQSCNRASGPVNPHIHTPHPFNRPPGVVLAASQSRPVPASATPPLASLPPTPVRRARPAGQEQGRGLGGMVVQAHRDPRAPPDAAPLLPPPHSALPHEHTSTSTPPPSPPPATPSSRQASPPPPSPWATATRARS